MKPKILVVDDNELIRDCLEEGLKRAGYTVVLADSAQNGLNMLIQQNLTDRHIVGHKIDLVISDYNMSETERPGDEVDDGDGMVRVAKRLFQEKNVVFPPVIIFTGCTDTLTIDFLREKVNEVIVKSNDAPSDVDLLLKKVAELLAKGEKE